MTFLDKFVLLLLLSFPLSIFSQILPPEFTCVSNDSLMWNTVNNTCGDFIAYDVYGSTNENGPYTVLASINDATATSFFHADANNQTWYYYLATNADCPGLTTMYSDTLDNLIPVAEPIESVSVQAGGVMISWYASESPEVVGYVISRNTQTGTTILDTVYGTTSYLDTSADAENMSETYFVVAIDACGNKSLVVDPHSTIYLEASTPMTCQTSIELSWNAYQNWAQGVDHYEVFVDIDGAGANMVAEVAADATSFTYEQANDGENLCFTIQAVETTTEARSVSSTACVDVAITQPLRSILALGASVNADGSISTEWLWDETAAITAANVQFSPANQPTITTEPFTLSAPLAQMNTYMTIGANAQLQAYDVQLQATDECTNQVLSNTSTTPFIQASAVGEGAVNRVRWNEYTHDFATSVSYELLKITPTGEQLLFTTTDELLYEDQLAETSDEQTCYLLRVNVEYTTADGTVLNRQLSSNIACVVPATKVYIPNVFTVDGINSTFRPYPSTELITDYSMDIYDRWGAHLFTSNDINVGWKGKNDGDALAVGVYLYVIEIQVEGGEKLQLTGDVMLLR